METKEILVKKFNEIKNIGFIKAENQHKNSVGVTLEKALGHTGGDFNIPDFYDIEIKALRSYYAAEFDLFNSSPDGKYMLPSKWVSEKFGYPDKDYREIKVFKGNVFCNKLNRIGLFYNFKLEIDYGKEKIFLAVYDCNFKLVNRDIYWDFDTLKEKLERKLKKIAIFWYTKKVINNETYFKFYKMKYYELINFQTFLEAIRKGYVYVTFKTGVFKTGKYKGTFTDHGTSFRIGKNNMNCIFNECT